MPTRRLLAGTGAGLVLLLVGGGAVLGWWINSLFLSARVAPEPAAPTIVTVPGYGSNADVVTPDVRGLDENAARQALGDAGIPSDVVQVTSRPAAGTPGVIIDQKPAFGTVSPAQVEIVVSTPATVPVLVGMEMTPAEQQLQVLGAEVEIVRTYRAGATPGQVLTVEPAADQPLPQQVKLTVAEAPAAVYLETLDTVEGYASSGEKSVNGVRYPHAVTLSASSEGGTNAWIIGRVSGAFTATVGIADDADPDSAGSITILADGVPVGSANVAYGKPQEIEVITDGALRLEIVATSSSTDSTDITLADAKVLGGQEALKALGEEP